MPGPSFAPGIAVPGDWPFCPLTTALNTVQDTKGPKVSHTAPGDGGGGGCWKATVTPFLPDCSMWLFRPGSAEQPQQTDTQRELWLSVLARTLPPNTLDLSCPGQGHSLASRSIPHRSLDGIPEAACAQKKNASCSAFERHPRPTRTTLEHPASPSCLGPATLKTHAKGPSYQPWACRALPHSHTQMLLHDTDREGDRPKLPQLDRVKPSPQYGLLSPGPLR